VKVTKEYVFEPSVFDPHDQDEYEYWVYTFDFGGRELAFRRYDADPEEASIADAPRKAEIYEDAEFAEAVAYLVREEGVQRVAALISSRDGGYVELDLDRLLRGRAS
jgi:hypothetical protein